MNHLTRNDYAAALRLLARLEGESDNLECFARASVAAVSEFVASEHATLSVSDLVTVHRQVAGLRLGADNIACLDQHIFEHPQVLHLGLGGGRATHPMSDALSRHDFLHTALYAAYCRHSGLEYAVAVPLFMDGRTLVSIVLNRRGVDFSARDCERLELLRPHLAFLYRQACAAAAPLSVASGASKTVPPAPLQADPLPADLTPRECEVIRWLSCGKTDAEIAALLAISPRTVQKHLEHIYVKLGVETRTAAVMRSLATSSEHFSHEKFLQNPSIMHAALLNR